MILDYFDYDNRLREGCLQIFGSSCLKLRSSCIVASSKSSQIKHCLCNYFHAHVKERYASELTSVALYYRIEVREKGAAPIILPRCKRASRNTFFYLIIKAFR